jgi:hypothetical protein
MGREETLQFLRSRREGALGPIVVKEATKNRAPSCGTWLRPVATGRQLA